MLETNLQMDVVTMLIAVATFMLTIAVQTWALVKYMINRIDKSSESLHSRVSKLRGEAVMKTEHDKELQRIYNELHATREEVKQVGRATTERMDALILTITGNLPRKD
jgi:ABC-type nickel/cobalt efflux system permease component RcnA